MGIINSILAKISTKKVEINSTNILTPEGKYRDSEISITALSENITINLPSGNPRDGNVIDIRIIDDGTVRNIGWGNYNVFSDTFSLPTETENGKELFVRVSYNSLNNGWNVLRVGSSDIIPEIDAIHTLTFEEASGTCRIRLYRGSDSAFTGNVYIREGTSGSWTLLSVSGTETTFPVTSKVMQVAHDWNKSGNDYMTVSFRGQATNLVGISLKCKKIFGSVGNYFMASYARDCTALETLSVPEFPLLESVGNYFMASYARGCTALETLSVPEFPLLESINEYFMISYAQNCSNLKVLKSPILPSVSSVGAMFMRYYASGCPSLETFYLPQLPVSVSTGTYFMDGISLSSDSLSSLILPKPGYLHNSSTNLGISSGRIGYLKGYVIDPDDLDDWKEKTSEGGFLYINKIQDPDDVVLLNP